jgi:DNA polymerase-3 subunit alpha
MGIDHNEINQINKFVPSDAGFQWKISECLYGDERTGKEPILEIQQYYEQHPELFHSAMDLEGNPRHTSIHAAGVILAPDKITKYLPLMLGSGNEVVSQWDMGDIEKAGLLKIDLLGLKTLGIIERTNKMIKANYGIDINYYNIDREDVKALKIIKDGNTASLFQIESEGMTSIFKRLNKVTFEDIVAVLSLYRPGPLQFVESYIRRANGQESITYLFPELEPILKNTYCILLYQEQIMAITTDCAGFTKAQSYIYRKYIGKILPTILVTI